jgi:hypothetical protein
MNADYLQALGKDKAWAGYCEIGAYSEAMDRPVLVVHAKDNLVHATKEVVCLMYEAEHGELIVPSDSDIQALWQNHAEDGGTKGYRGAAKKGRLDTDNAPICISQLATPKSNKSSRRLTDFGQCTPAKRSTCLTDFASNAKRSHRLSEPQEARPSGSNPSAASASASISTGPREINWTCHICEVSFTGKVVQVQNKRHRHIKKTHPEIPISEFSKAVPQFRVPITAVSHEATHGTASWTCVFCLGTVPFLPKTHRKASIKTYLRERTKAPKGATITQGLDRLCKRERVSPDQHHRSVLVWHMKLRQMYQRLHSFAEGQVLALHF